jgi:hypothetical protein
MNRVHRNDLALRIGVSPFRTRSTKGIAYAIEAGF